MISTIARMFIKEGSQAPALAALKELAAQVQQQEEGTLVYLIHTPETSSPSLPPVSPLEVIFYEVYKDEQAFQAHLNGAFKKFTECYANLFQTTPGGEIFLMFESINRDAGFISKNAVG